jgi:hypothetical protein
MTAKCKSLGTAGQIRWEMGLVCVDKAFKGAGDHHERQPLTAMAAANTCRF